MIDISNPAKCPFRAHIVTKFWLFSPDNKHLYIYIFV